MIRYAGGVPRRLTLLTLPVLAAGCLPSAGPSLEALETDRRVPAIVDAREGDVMTLVDALDDDDAVVRLSAVNRLRTLTGQSFGYAYWQNPDDRAEPIARWRAWAESRSQSRATSRGAG